MFHTKLFVVLCCFITIVVFTPAVAQNGPQGVSKQQGTKSTEKVVKTDKSDQLDTQQTRNRIVGVSLDIGVPDGASIGVTLSPTLCWVKGTLSLTTNAATLGYRLGVTLDPVKWALGPSLTFEYGNYSMFNISSMVGTDIPSISYDYINLHGGLEIGNPKVFRFFIHAGPSWINVRSYGLQDFVVNKNKENKDVSISKLSDIKGLLVVLPTIKFGFCWMVF